MNQKEIFELIAKFESSNLSSLEIKENDFSITMEKNAGATAGTTLCSTPTITMQATENAGEVAIENPLLSNEENNNAKIKAPLVGTFYTAPSPKDEPFVKLGQKVTKGQTLCLIEAMKMMNELKSPIEGEICAIHAENSTLVEFDQLLFEVKPC